MDDLPSPVFVSKNNYKVAEVMDVLGTGAVVRMPPGLDDLDEIQAATAERIAQDKAKRAFYAVNHHARRTQGTIRWLLSRTPLRPVLVEDTSLELDAWGGMPGPYIKWTMERHGPAGLWDLVRSAPTHVASATSVVVYYYKAGPIFVSETCTSRVRGTVVAPRGLRGFGFDSIFQPEGSEQTLAEMDVPTRMRFSPRAVAIRRVMARTAEGGRMQQ